jgi:hypothetical protein
LLSLSHQDLYSDCDLHFNKGVLTPCYSSVPNAKSAVYAILALFGKRKPNVRLEHPPNPESLRHS